MIVELGGGKGGLKEYLEHGKKRGRELHRDHLDQRVPLAGDLAVFELATQAHAGVGQRYDHITLSFAESHVSDEMLQVAVIEFRDHVLAAWPEEERHRIAFYAEAHRPRVLSYTHSETGEWVERLTHIHIGLGKHDLLTGAAIEPMGFMGPQSDNLKYIDAWQESFNARHGFASPKDNPKITPENAVDVLSRYTGQRPDHLGTFNQMKAAFEVTLQKQIIGQNITTWDGLGELLATHGLVTTMREGQFGECYRIKPHGASRAMRLQGVFFQRQFIERPTVEKVSIVSDKARTAYLEQMQSRKEPKYVASTLSDWHQFKARENRYLHTGSKFYQEVYQPADAATRQSLLDQIERNHLGIQGTAATQSRKSAAPRNRVPKLPVRNLDGIQSRTQMLLRDHPGVDVRAESAAQSVGVGLRQADGGRRGGGASARPITQSDCGPGQDADQAGDAIRLSGTIQPSSVLARVETEMRERYQQASDKERYAEIRKYLDCAQLLDSLSHSHGINPDLYTPTKAKDGTPRIQCGTRALSPNDFLTKELGLAWRDAAQILRKTFEHQIGRKGVVARGRAGASPLWLEMKAEQLAARPGVLQRLKNFDEETKIRRAALVSELKGEQARALAELSGASRKAAQSLEKLRAATVKAEFADSRRVLRKAIQPTQADAWRIFLHTQAQAGNEEALAALRKLDGTARASPAQAISGTIYLSDDDEQAKRRRRRTRESSASILRLLTYLIEANGDITYSQQGRAVLRDEGRHLAVLDEQSEVTIAVALLLAREKFGNNLTLTGSSEFQHRVVAVAAAQGIAIKFVDLQLEAMRLQFVDEIRLAAREKVVHRRATNCPDSSPPAQKGPDSKAAVADGTASSKAAPKALPLPELSPLTPVTVGDRARRADTQVAKAALTADLQSQGREVRSVEDGIQYLGTVEITADGRFAVQSLGRGVIVIHELAQLNGRYTSGDEVQIRYVDGQVQEKTEPRRQDRLDGVGL